MPETHVHEDQNEKFDNAKAIDDSLSDATPDPSASRIDDSEEARAMAEASDTLRTQAADERKSSAEHLSGASDRMGLGQKNPEAAASAMDRAEATDNYADQIEEWAQALHRHPELQGESLDGEPVTAQSLLRLSMRVDALTRDAKSARATAAEVLSKPLEPDFGYHGYEPGDSSLDHISAQMHGKLKELRANGASDDELKQTLADWYMESAEGLAAEAATAQSLLDRLKS
jgi:hypothetical protein